MHSTVFNNITERRNRTEKSWWGAKKKTEETRKIKVHNYYREQALTCFNKSCISTLAPSATGIPPESMNSAMPNLFIEETWKQSRKTWLNLYQVRTYSFFLFPDCSSKKEGNNITLFLCSSVAICTCFQYKLLWSVLILFENTFPANFSTSHPLSPNQNLESFSGCVTSTCYLHLSPNNNVTCSFAMVQQSGGFLSFYIRNLPKMFYANTNPKNSPLLTCLRLSPFSLSFSL